MPPVHSHSVTNKGEQWTRLVTPSDGIADGTSGMATVTIANTPKVSSVTVTPSGKLFLMMTADMFGGGV